MSTAPEATDPAVPTNLITGLLEPPPPELQEDDDPLFSWRDFEYIDKIVKGLCENHRREGVEDGRRHELRRRREESGQWMEDWWSSYQYGRQRAFEEMEADRLRHEREMEVVRLRHERRRRLTIDVFLVVKEILWILGGLLVFYCAICLAWCIALSLEYQP